MSKLFKASLDDNGETKIYNNHLYVPELVLTLNVWVNIIIKRNKNKFSIELNYVLLIYLFTVKVQYYVNIVFLFLIITLFTIEHTHIKICCLYCYH